MLLYVHVLKKKRINYNHLRILLAGESRLQGQKQKPENQKLKNKNMRQKRKIIIVIVRT